MKVSDIMSKQVEYIAANKSVREASILIFARGVNGIPVCKNKKLVGFITERDILAKFYPTIGEYLEDPIHAGDFEAMEQKVSEILALTVDKIMSKSLITVTPETAILHAQSLMLVHKIGRLPVIDKKGNLVGILSKGDIFNVLVGGKLIFVENVDYNDWLSKTYYAAVDWNDRLIHEMPDLLKVFNKNNVETIIDVGCGTGEHPIEFAKKGFKVIGIDRSKSMIVEANIRESKLSKEIQQRIDFYKKDAIDFFPKHKKTFDCALFMGNTISHNPLIYKEVIKKTVDYLSKTGILILQITNFEKVLKTKNRLLSLTFAELDEGIKREYAFLEFYDLPNKKDNTILKTFAILRSDSRRWKPVGVRNSLMAYTNKESIKEILMGNGFKNISFYGGSFDGRKWDYLFRKPFDPLESDWLNVIAIRE